MHRMSKVYDDITDDPTVRIFVIDELFGVPLYGFYVVSVAQFAPGEIEGTLMTPPIDITGPFTSRDEALILTHKV